MTTIRAGPFFQPRLVQGRQDKASAWPPMERDSHALASIETLVDEPEVIEKILAHLGLWP